MAEVTGEKRTVMMLRDFLSSQGGRFDSSDLNVIREFLAATKGELKEDWSIVLDSLAG